MEEFLIVVLTLSFDWVRTCLKPTPSLHSTYSFILWHIGYRPMIFLNMCINLDVNPINSQLTFLGCLTKDFYKTP